MPDRSSVNTSPFETHSVFPDRLSIDRNDPFLALDFTREVFGVGHCCHGYRFPLGIPVYDIYSANTTEHWFQSLTMVAGLKNGLFRQ